MNLKPKPMQEFRINYNEVELDVAGMYYIGRAETREEPAEPSEFDVYSVDAGGVNIVTLLSEEQIEEIIELIIEIIEE